MCFIAKNTVKLIDSMLSAQEKAFLIAKIESGEKLPPDFKEKLFPTIQKEYELQYAGKMRKQDILANEDGVSPLPLQIEKIYNNGQENLSNQWQNLIVFGDNLQFLKTCYENKDNIIKDKIKGKVKLIYIDPPFGTGDEYDGNRGQKAYSAKVKGADFVEFVRRRLIVAKEILASNGIIVIRQAFNFGHYIKIALDEIFGKENFINEVLIGRKREGAGSMNKFDVSNEVLFLYSKSSDYKINDISAKRSLTDIKWTSFLMAEERNPKERIFFGLTLLPPKGQHFSLIQAKCDKLVREHFLRLRCKDCGTRYYYSDNEIDLEKRIKHKTDKFKFYDIYSDTTYFGVEKVDKCLTCKSENFTVDYLGSDDAKISNNWFDIRSYSSTTGYPTENSEDLLERIIKATTQENDLILDFFGGSGSTAAVAEKLNRRWVTCDIGKFSYYTMQKRLLKIQESKDFQNPKKIYDKQARTFATVNAGIYDLAKLVALNRQEYKNFVLNLFEATAKQKIVNGIQIDGERYGYDIQIFNFWDYKANIDETYLENLHLHLKNRVGNRFYLIAPANCVDFIADYYEIENVKYYFLKVPYQIINELHKKEFKKFRQPQSKQKINELDDAVGFHFMRQPEVVSRLENNELIISQFKSLFSEESTGKEMNNFESLSMLIIDENFNGTDFMMTRCEFAEDLIKAKKRKQQEAEDESNIFAENLKKELSLQNEIRIQVNVQSEKICVIYVDIYGNEFRETLNVT